MNPEIDKSRDSWKNESRNSWMMSIQIDPTHTIAIWIKPLHIYRIICRLAPSTHILSWREQQSRAANEVPLAPSPQLKCQKLYTLLFIWLGVVKPAWWFVVKQKSEIISPLIFSIFHISHSSYLYPFLFTYLSISRCFCWFSRIERRSIDKHKRASTVTHATMRRLPTRNSAQNCS